MVCIAAVTHVVAAANVNDLPVLKADICRRPNVRRLVMPLPEITVQTLRQRAQLCHKHTHTCVYARIFATHSSERLVTSPIAISACRCVANVRETP